jgi:neutral ceramidase
VGDQSARLPAGLPYGAAEYGDAVRARVDALRYPAPEAEPALAFARARSPLPPPSPGAVPALLRRAAANLLFRGTPRSAVVSALRVGDVVLLAIPAEPVAEAGARLRGAAGGEAVIVSLAGDYLGYVETPERTAAGEGEAVRTYYGPALSERLEEGVRAAAAAVEPGRGP